MKSKIFSSDIDRLFSSYPRKRLKLEEGQQAIYEKEYKLGRTGATPITRLAQKTEAWMHMKVAETYMPQLSTLEIGAGTLNQLDFEGRSKRYDIVEPMKSLYAGMPNLANIDTQFDDIKAIPSSAVYDRITSVAALEHITDLPTVLAKSGLHLGKNGKFCAGIPSEGGVLWGVSWRLTTGLAYFLRTGYSYSRLMRHEHVNDAIEIIALVDYFFDDFKLSRFPFPSHHSSLFTYIEATNPRIEACDLFLATLKS